MPPPYWRVVLLGLSLLVIATNEAGAASGRLSGRVVDENSLAVPGAQVALAPESGGPVLYETSDVAGRFSFTALPAESYQLRVQKKGYYAFLAPIAIESERPGSIEVTLNHQQEYEETVSVVYSTPVIDPQETTAQTTLTAEEIIDIPYPASHDFRNALPMVPGVIKDNQGRIHLNGGGENQALYTLDGFNLTSPVTGLLENRISVDALRAIRVETSRYSAESGKASAGTVALETLRGDDRFRFSATNFLPSYEFHDGFAISNWNPRASFSGPLARGKAWFFNAMDLQYDLNIVDDLPSTANTNRNWTGSNLTRLQLNLNPRNVITGTFLLNFRNSRHLGITPLDPVETSRNLKERFYFMSLKHQAFMESGWLVESGFSFNSLNTRERPLGEEVYRIAPEGRSGNYFRFSEGNVERGQWVASALTPTLSWQGRHSVKFGIAADTIRYRQLSSRGPMEVHRHEGNLSRLVTFSGEPGFGRDNLELAGFVQDRWSPGETLMVEAGLRFDWDQILRDPLWSPRLALTWSPRKPDTKLSAGIGLFYDATNLGMLTRGLDQQRVDTYYYDDGVTVMRGPVRSSYIAFDSDLKAPVYLNWSLGLEQKLPRDFYLKSNFIRKRGQYGWSYVNITDSFAPNPVANEFQLRNSRNDSYRFLELTVTRTFGKHPWLFSYANSSARSSAVLDYSLDNPILGLQDGGPLDWDVPHRIISWAAFPTPFMKKYTLSYFLEWHSGFPYTVVDELQHLVGSPNDSRYPDYFSLNLHMERRFRTGRAEWALRAGFNNLTGHHNPVSVINSIASPDFRTLSGGQGRVFTGRLRFLGRN